MRSRAPLSWSPVYDFLRLPAFAPVLARPLARAGGCGAIAAAQRSCCPSPTPMTPEANRLGEPCQSARRGWISPGTMAVAPSVSFAKRSASRRSGHPQDHGRMGREQHLRIVHRTERLEYAIDSQRVNSIFWLFQEIYRIRRRQVGRECQRQQSECAVGGHPGRDLYSLPWSLHRHVSDHLPCSKQSRFFRRVLSILPPSPLSATAHLQPLAQPTALRHPGSRCDIDSHPDCRPILILIVAPHRRLRGL